jgi:teichuronic acid biosynthesis glycosyltransferase TuaC
MRVAVVTEFYPRQADPTLGIWAHRQALATRDAGVEVVVFVLHRMLGRRNAALHQPRLADIDGIRVRYVRYVSPPRPWSYAQWGWWAASGLRRAVRAEGAFDVVHAHNAVPAGDAILRARLGLPLVVSVHGGDVLWTVASVPRGAVTVSRTLAQAQLVLANSAGTERLAREHDARSTRVVHLGSDLPAVAARSEAPLIATVANLVARKRHADVLRALADVPEARYLVVGDGPERAALERLAQELGVARRVEFAGRLDPGEALGRSRAAWLFALPSTEEAFGVAYIEAMAAGIPAIGCAGEPGPLEIAAAGEGIVLVPAHDPQALAVEIRRLLGDGAEWSRLSRAARETVERAFSWKQCGLATLAAYEDAIR